MGELTLTALTLSALTLSACTHSMYAVVYNRSREEVNASIASVFVLLSALGAASGPLVTGPLVDAVGLSWVGLTQN